MSSPAPAPSRRTVLLSVLGASLGASALGGCQATGSRTTGPEQDLPEGTTSAAPGPEGVDAGVDGEALAQLRTEVQDLAAMLSATLVTHPGLSQDLAGSQRLCLDHDRVLAQALGQDAGLPTPAETASGAALPVPRTPARALAKVRTAHAAYATHLLAGAGTATSPELARVLAAMGAGASQHHAALADRAA